MLYRGPQGIIIGFPSFSTSLIAQLISSLLQGASLLASSLRKMQQSSCRYPSSLSLRSIGTFFLRAFLILAIKAVKTQIPKLTSALSLIALKVAALIFSTQNLGYCPSLLYTLILLLYIYIECLAGVIITLFLLIYSFSRIRLYLSLPSITYAYIVLKCLSMSNQNFVALFIQDSFFTTPIIYCSVTLIRFRLLFFQNFNKLILQVRQPVLIIVQATTTLSIIACTNQGCLYSYLQQNF